MRSMEFSGRTVDEAIFHGLTEMGLSIDEVDITTVQNESKGIFGIGAKNAIVRLTEREVKAVPMFEKPQRQQREGDSGSRSREGRGGSNKGSRRSNDRAQRHERTEREDAKAEAPDYPYTKEYADGQPAAAFLRELLDKMDIEAEVTGCDVDGDIRLNITSSTDGLLIGRRGETLDALQYLVSLYINKDNKDESYVRVTVDTEGYRARREETLRRLARRSAARVAKSGRAMTMEPMNPYERRVIHSSLQSFKGVTTHSEGQEPNRRVVISPVK